MPISERESGAVNGRSEVLDAQLDFSRRAPADPVGGSSARGKDFGDREKERHHDAIGNGQEVRDNPLGEDSLDAAGEDMPRKRTGTGSPEVRERGDRNGHRKGGETRLLHWEEMPRHLQFNPYVRTGYRPLQSAWGCVYSLCYLHNETVNILTHGLPIIYIVAVVPKLLPWEAGAGSPFLAWCHLAGALAPWCGSFLYHLFMNTSRGAEAYKRLLQIDMLGIWVSQSFGALPMVCATAYCMPWVYRWFIISAYCLLSIWGLYKAMTAWSPWERRLCFLLPFSMRALLAWSRAARLSGGNPEAISHIVLQDAVSAIGGVIGAVNIPERWFPGAVDMYLNSHNIMHVLVVTAVYFMHHATVLDISWMSRVQCYDEDVSTGSLGSLLPGALSQF